MFVTTADPVREPPILVVNTVLSLLAVNYPANKLACYVSDDGCSALTYFSLKEASKFAKIWVPFCKKYNVRVRAPFRYFLNPVDAKEDSEFSRDWEMTKVTKEPCYVFMCTLTSHVLPFLKLYLCCCNNI